MKEQGQSVVLSNTFLELISFALSMIVAPCKSLFVETESYMNEDYVSYISNVLYTLECQIARGLEQAGSEGGGWKHYRSLINRGVGIIGEIEKML